MNAPNVTKPKPGAGALLWKQTIRNYVTLTSVYVP